MKTFLTRLIAAWRLRRSVKIYAIFTDEKGRPTWDDW